MMSDMDMDEPERVRTYDAHTGEPHDDVLRTKSGKVLTDADIWALADAAEEDIERAIGRLTKEDPR